MIKRLSKYFDLHLYKSTLPAILIALITVPCTMLLPTSYGFENGPIENLQMLVLILACIIAFCSRNHPKLFHFVGLIIIALLLRETNCGRTLFFAVPGTENSFYKWSEIKYGWLVHPLYGIFVACTVAYFIFNKLHRDILQIIHTIKFPLWCIILLMCGFTFGLCAEKIMHNMVFEELAELLFYVALSSTIYIYASTRAPASK